MEAKYIKEKYIELHRKYANELEETRSLYCEFCHFAAKIMKSTSSANKSFDTCKYCTMYSIRGENCQHMDTYINDNMRKENDEHVKLRKKFHAEMVTLLCQAPLAWFTQDSMYHIGDRAHEIDKNLI